MTRSRVLVTATLDTKRAAATTLVDELRARGLDVVLVDVGTRAGGEDLAEVSMAEVVAASGALRDADPGDRASLLAVRRRGVAALVRALVDAGELAGLIAIGGGTGAAVAADAFAAVPIGVPKMLVSTGVTGDVEAIVGGADVILVQPAVDLVGSSDFLAAQLKRAAAIAAAAIEQPTPSTRGAVAVTAFGVTERAVAAAVERLEQRGLPVVVLHARGSGGRALELLARSGALVAVLDLTTTEVIDEVAGGQRSAGPGRLDEVIAAGLPLVIAPGALDVINFGARAQLPPEWSDRVVVEHSALTTLVRSSAHENKQAARWIAAKLGSAAAPTRIVLPTGGFSRLSEPGGPFRDPAADDALRDEFAAALASTGTEIVHVDGDLDTEGFGIAAADILIDLIHDHPTQEGIR